MTPEEAFRIGNDVMGYVADTQGYTTEQDDNQFPPDEAADFATPEEASQIDDQIVHYTTEQDNSQFPQGEAADDGFPASNTHRPVGRPREVYPNISRTEHGAARRDACMNCIRTVLVNGRRASPCYDNSEGTEPPCFNCVKRKKK